MYCPVNLLESSQKKEEHPEANSKFVPTLKTDDIFLSQSVAILEYLEET
ncbi:15375_t:CDS:2 [Gigaspora rosea]|nr:15375_t:CDS:2 [Gigaspora rosea]